MGKSASKHLFKKRTQELLEEDSGAAQDSEADNVHNKHDQLTFAVDAADAMTEGQENQTRQPSKMSLSQISREGSKASGGGRGESKESRHSSKSSLKFKAGVQVLIAGSRFQQGAADAAQARKDEERYQLEKLVCESTEPTSVSELPTLAHKPLPPAPMRQMRRLAALPKDPPNSLTLRAEEASPRRIDDWRRSSDKNLCHVYRLCEEFQQLGCGQSRPDHHIRGIDFIMDRNHVRSELASDEDEDVFDGHSAKVRSNLLNSEYFSTLGATTRNYFASLAKKANFEREISGQVVFRQGDICKNVYVLVKGEIAVHRLSEEEIQDVNSPRLKDCPGILTMTETHSSDTEKRRGSYRRNTLSRRSSRRKISTAMSSVSITTVGGELNQRYKTSEGLSTFCGNSKLGKQVASRGPYTAIGERGVSATGIRRPATIKCTTDCEFLVVKNSDYLEVMREVVLKARWFDDQVLQCRKVMVNGLHVSSFFMQGQYQQGHAFLTEGIGSKPIIYIIRRGVVEFRQCEDPIDDPAAAFQHTHVQMSEGWPLGRKPMLSYGTLGEGDMFCSLAFLPLQAYEPLSAVVATPDSIVYRAEGRFLDKFPQHVIDSLRQHCLEGLVSRLLCLREKIPEAFLPPTRTKMTLPEWVNYKQQKIMESKLGSPLMPERRTPQFLQLDMNPPFWNMPGAVADDCLH